MRYMMLMIPEPYDITPENFDRDALAKMMAFNKSMMEAGVLIVCDGLHPASSGARVTFDTGKPIVTDGPFTESKEVVGGYWIIDVASRDDAIAWASKCPAAPTDIIEIRRVQEIEDFQPDVRTTVSKLGEKQARRPSEH